LAGRRRRDLANGVRRGWRKRIELDVHVVDLREGVVVPLCNVPWRFETESLNGRGFISFRPIARVSARTQVAMGSGRIVKGSGKAEVT
jgi:hypothetical protein